MEGVQLVEENLLLPDYEQNIRNYWKEIKLYSRILEKNNYSNKPIYDMLDGPPFVSNDNLHYGHVHIGFLKNIVLNFYQMKGFNVKNKIGYDTHGMPIESYVNKILNINTKEDIEEYGLKKYENKCKETINILSGCWLNIYEKMARFLMPSNNYKTMDLNYMETVWWTFAQLWSKNIIYFGFKVMPFSTVFGTPLSNFEVSGDDTYKEIEDTSVYVKFKAKNNNYSFLIWTTTPWTLPSNISICMNPTSIYLLVKCMNGEEEDILVLAKDCLNNVFSQKNKNFQVISEHPGSYFLNQEYIPIFKNFSDKFNTYKIIVDPFVDTTNKTGSGLVHMAPAFGVDDLDICLKNNLIRLSEVGEYCPVSDYGIFDETVTDFKKLHVFEANPLIIEYLQKLNVLVKKQKIKHKYPHCPRSDTPLIYKATRSLFMQVTKIKDDIINNNNKINWSPEHIGKGRFGKWLENIKDWCISRNRFFGNPIPLWTNDDWSEIVIVDSIEKLVKLANLPSDKVPTDIHKSEMDKIQIPSKSGRGFLKRCPFIFDCWFESGVAPIAQIHYPFENKNFFDNKDFLCDFICEAQDQCRGWFYTLLVISTAIFNKPAFKNVICSGLILAPDGKKFSKRLNNFVPPEIIINKFTSDALRLYLSGSPAANAESFRFNEEDIGQILKKYIQFFNVYKLAVEIIIKFKKDGYSFDIDSFLLANNFMDIWILSRLKNTAIQIEQFMSQYKIFKIKEIILSFLEDLTNWYVKFNRKRFKGVNCSPSDQLCALSTLYNVIKLFTVICAPFIPHLSDVIFLNLQKEEFLSSPLLSVHLCDYPDLHFIPFAPDIERKMLLLQKISSHIRTIRSQNKNIQSVKIPLKNLDIICSNREHLDDFKIIERYLKDEINCLNINFSIETFDIKYIVSPNHKNLGTKYKKMKDPIINLINNLDIKILLNLQNNIIDGIDLSIDDFSFKLTKEDFIVEHRISDTEIAIDTHSAQKSEKIIDTKSTKSDNIQFLIDNVLFKLDISFDDIVKENYMTRLIIVFTQKLRKNSNLKPWDPIFINYITSDNILLDVLDKFKNKITEEIMHDILINDNISQEIISNETFSLIGHDMQIILHKKN